MEETKAMDSETRKCAFFQKPTYSEGENEAYEKKYQVIDQQLEALRQKSPRQERGDLKSMRHLENFRELYPPWNNG